MRMVIKDGTLVSASDTFQADILIVDEKIVKIDQSLHVPDAEPVDASNKLVLPGGVGDRLPIMCTHGVRTGKMTAEQFVALNATNPAKIFGLYPRKGALLPGSDADIVIVGSGKESKIRRRPRPTPYRLQSVRRLGIGWLSRKSFLTRRVDCG